MTIPPCTTGKHSTIDDTPAPEAPKISAEEVEAKIAAQNAKAKEAESLQPAVARVAVTPQAPRTPRGASPAPPEDEDDDPSLPVPESATCKRKGCGASYTGAGREGEECVHHPGQALFHEGSKGWTCCKKRVLEFDEFMKIPGCTTKPQHLFVGRKKDPAQEEVLSEVRNDFYQTSTTVIASLYLKKIDKDRSSVRFASPASDEAGAVELDLHTSDSKHYATTMQLFGLIKAEESSFKIMGTKLELTIVKADNVGWPVLRADDPQTGSIIQAGRAGRA